MIKFFRQIRQTLLSEGKTGKYLKYAIGEIILVVIGILIALSINNWNTSNQQRKEEKRILISLKNDVINDTIQLRSNIISSQNRISKIDTVYIALSNTQLYSPSEFLRFAYTLAGSSEFNVNSGTFDESLSTGSLKYIRNDTLRRNIFEYYRMSKLNTIDKYATQQKYDVVFPVMFKTLSTTQEFFEDFIGKTTKFQSIDIQNLSENIEFVAAVNQRYASEVNQINYWNNFISISRNLITEIEKELASL